ncbi:signal peptide peptidase SppA [Vibrio rumoiensis]|uniref:Signal peptide peptidase SppA n=1 Tax=Vibrio rumoiensis 1S-45 TaxID=1188252 RepID=A0A1E5E4G5_9VIBR|nr:signal peptide peptidase SppA [Vibrio rumoiensis]OEF27673.1 signal peptide peptidase SppA [Vibrio rumoiensis 1S-45]
MKKLFCFIAAIFKGIWKFITFIRVAIVNVIFIALIVMVYFAFYPQQEPSIDQPTTPEKRALVLNLDGPIVEQRTYVNPLDSISGTVFDNELPKENVLYDIVTTLRAAATDNSISGLVLNLSQMPETNLTKLRYIAKAISEFKATGKPIYAYGDFYNQSQYYLASYASQAFLSPDGAVLLKGYSAYNLYYKDLLDKLDVTTHIFRVGTYKSAVEPFLRNDMSTAAKESATAWLTQLWGAYVDDVAHNRKIDTKALNPSMDEFLAKMKSVDGDLAKLSLETGLVDQLMTRQQATDFFASQFGASKDHRYNRINYYDYKAKVAIPVVNTADQIAVVVASGTILDGTQPKGRIGGDSTASLLAQARLDKNVKAVILRVDSPGGSAFASEIIRNEIEALKKAGKPVVASMSSLAASGGYWISMSADKIIAQPTTLTGSIGIFGVITTFEKGLNKLGVHTDGIGTSPFSGVGLTNGLSEGASQAMQMGIEHGYHRFISLVGKNRDMKTDEVDNVAQGRVWTGQDAMKHGLVDQLGDFDDAIKAAANLAHLDSYKLTWVDKPLSPTQQILEDFFRTLNTSLGNPLEKWIPDALKPAAAQMSNSVDLLNSFNDPKGYYAFCLNCEAI